jgi:hypothetical protein
LFTMHLGCSKKENHGRKEDMVEPKSLILQLGQAGLGGGSQARWDSGFGV